jgi:4-hydroxy-3-methylbut-2-enyl diphosphate reductase
MTAFADSESTSTSPDRSLRWCALVFDAQNLLGVRGGGDGPWEVSACGNETEPAAVRRRIAAIVGEGPTVEPLASFGAEHGEPSIVVYACSLRPQDPRPDGWSWTSIVRLRTAILANTSVADGFLRAALRAIEPQLIRVPYLNFGENEYLYRFRTESQRNRAVYNSDERGRVLYQSALCDAIKAVRRQKERTADDPAVLDFGAVRYVLPSHFGFCLGVQNAIERAYETIAENPGRRVYMISELIHNPFVNDDLRERGLVYLQTDRGVHLKNPATGRDRWDELVEGDIVLTPAFGATDADKVKLIERGIAVNRYDATCMLVEKVWKAARRYAQSGYSIVIHGKGEHEETKATFSNCAKYAPSIVIRDLAEARRLGEVVLAPDRETRLARFAAFAPYCSGGFDPERDLDRLAVVNQTTLLRNETVAIIEYLETVFAERFGADAVEHHLHARSKGDTLCYATQVNQDALQRALSAGADAAIVVGGRNSSNTYQLFRMCREHFGARAFYIQSEHHVLGRDRIRHYHYPYKPGQPKAGEIEELPFLPDLDRPLTILLTGGASCPDGIIQQVVTRINALFPAESLRSMEAVVDEVLACGA